MTPNSVFACLLVAAVASGEPPTSWIDPDTGHRVVRLTSEPGSASLYFNQNGYTADGKRLVYTTPGGISVLDLTTHQVRQMVQGNTRLIDAGRRSQRVYYLRDGAAYSTDVDTGDTRKIGDLPPRGSISTVNADETLLAGTYIEGAGQDYRGNRNQQSHPLDQPRNKGQMMEERWAARLPMALYTVDIRTGEVKTIHKSNDWLNHLLFSPTDPSLLMFCHEGPWHKVDRTWTIRTDGSGLTQIHHRTMNMEIEGHEFFSGDGKMIWYDLQTPKSHLFWLAGYNVSTGERTWYHLERSEWSVHFNVSPDGTLFAGDGGGPNSVAAPGNGQWIYLFQPEMVADKTDGVWPSPNQFIKPGFFKAEKLVNLAKHDYRLEPNVTFSPDMKWIIFRSNMLGPTHVYAVEIKKATS